ncbi:MAG: 23S rRNA (pseudouridine(1915)-N(3))-methyltransferase RlmH [Acidobacteria bacterium]|nr:23S rRNA (pseudouridine(1915)-N(3))-methyltransferase RlmH [Acidobacteriota bacterium]
MQVRVLWIGKTRLPGAAALTEEYSKRLRRFCDLQAEEVRPKRKSKAGAGLEAAMTDRSEGCYRVVLDPAGSQWNSEKFAGFLGELRGRGQPCAAFCVGGADGFSVQFRQKADRLLSLSQLTLPHELARVVLLEQIYRAFTLLAHHPYPR